MASFAAKRGMEMNRYDWLLLAFRILLKSGAIEKARELIIELETSDKAGADKRKIVEEAILPKVKTGSVYVVRALIELLIAQMKEK